MDNLQPRIFHHLRYGALKLAQRISRPFSKANADRLQSLIDKAEPKQATMAEAMLRRGGTALNRAVDFAVSEDPVPYGPPPPIDPKVKLIAFYLPQFHPFPENDEFWGKGFTEWTNVGKAKPNFVGHYQPHCPIHFGYYDLRLPEIMEEQAKVAKEYGIGGFAHYFYWFNGKNLMERPLREMLSNPKVDIPFCFIWANEDWARNWQGKPGEKLLESDNGTDELRALLRHMLPYFQDPRYIRIDGRPLCIIYRPNNLPDAKDTLVALREEALRLGQPGVYFVAAQSKVASDPRDAGFDAAMEFPPHGISSTSVKSSVRITNRAFKGTIRDYLSFAKFSSAKPEPDYKLLRATMLGWDNTARRQDNGFIVANFSVTAYARWLAVQCRRVLRNDKYSSDEKIVFVNAWNEWAEGTHLEPDQKHGFGYLKATYDVLAHLDDPGNADREGP